MKLRLFEGWFRTLVNNRMAGAALPIAGISIGYVVIQGSRFVPDRYTNAVGDLGLALMGSSVVVFVVSMAGFAWLWLIRSNRTRSR